MKRPNRAILAPVLVVALFVCALAGCAPETSGPSEGSGSPEGSAEMAFKWSEGSDCAMCHEGQSGAHALGHEAVACVECHSDAASLEAAHAKVTLDDTDGAKNLKSTKVEEAACLACHAADYTPEATADFTACIGSGSAVTNPHDLPQIVDHDGISCSSCHPEHSGLVAAETAPLECENCHE